MNTHCDKIIIFVQKFNFHIFYSNFEFEFLALKIELGNHNLIFGQKVVFYRSVQYDDGVRKCIEART